MIYHLNGSICEKVDDGIVIDVNGIGYFVFLTDHHLANCPEPPHTTKIYTYHHIREDHQHLYGFETLEEKEIFLKLTSVSGIGPKVGMKILSHLPKDTLIQAIMTGNVVQITQVPGVGKKGAERLIIELKDKLSHLSTPTSIPSASLNYKNPIHDDLTMALKTLGYSQDEIKKALKKSAEKLSDSLTLEQGIKVLLKYL